MKYSRCRGAAGKTPVFGLLERGGKVFVKVVPNCSKEELMPIIQGKIIESLTSALMDGGPTMVLYSTDTAIIGYFITKTNSRAGNLMSTELKGSGATSREDLRNSMG